VVLLRALSVALVLFVLPAQAWAQCNVPYAAQKLLSDMQSAQISLSIDDPEGFVAAGTELERGLPCLNEKIPPRGLAAAYRIVSLMAYRKGDEPRSRRWARTARELDPDYEWGAVELDAVDPYRAVYDSERVKADAPPVQVEGMRLLLPEGSVLLLDGRPLERAAARMERYHVLQHFSDAEGHLQSWIINGNGIPAQFMEEGEEATDEPEDTGKKKSKGKVAEDAPYSPEEITVIDRVAPKGKKAAIAMGFVGALAAGGAYAGSYLTRQDFDGANSEDDLVKYRRMTNGLVVASGGLLVVGLGVGWWGVALDGGAVVGRTWKF
jgi:hypothetical protein